MQIIGEASDGLLAVQRACELQPDLILLDIGLPSLNGIEVARRIQDGTPQSKVLFVSENRSRDIAAECLRAGAHGCVVKSEARRELLSAVRTVLSGRKFISTSLGASDLLSDDNPRLSNAPERIEALAPLPPRNAQIRHEVAFYSDDEALVHAFTRVTKAALHVGNTAIVIAKEAHRIKILQRLKGDRTNLKAFQAEGRFAELDAEDVLAKVMVNDHPDRDRCATVLEHFIGRLGKASNRKLRRIAICGECAPTLLKQGNVEGAIELEHVWDELTRAFDADTLCGYIQGVFLIHNPEVALQRICAEHSAIQGRELGY